jgi:hypothetical protein
MELLIVSAAGTLSLLAAEIAEFIYPWVSSAREAARSAARRWLLTGVDNYDRAYIALIKRAA